MIETKYQWNQTDEKIIEKVIMDENLHYMHMVLPKGDRLPEHFSNSEVYMNVVRGKLSIGLDDQLVQDYEAGTILHIPFNTKMNVFNENEEVLELFVTKAPAPK